MSTRRTIPTHPRRRSATGAAAGAATLACCLLWLPAALAAPPTIDELSPDSRALLDSGGIVMLPMGSDDETRALVRVAAAPDRVWAVVSDPQHIRSSARSVKQLDVYLDQLRTDGVREQHLGYVLKVAFSDVHYNVIRLYDTAAGTMTWTLDDSRDNDIAATTGGFNLSASADGGTLFAYEARVDTGHHMPSWIQKELTESSLKRFLSYVQDVAPSGH